MSSGEELLSRMRPATRVRLRARITDVLREHGPMRAGQLAVKVSASDQAVSAMRKRMEAEGLLRSYKDPTARANPTMVALEFDPVSALVAPVLDLALLAQAFAQVDRTAVHTLVGLPETDTDHTVMLGWVAPALAHRLYPEKLRPELVAAFALVHDAPEIFAGDVPTLRAEAVDWSTKERAEAAATARLDEETKALPWFGEMLWRYHSGEEPEARWVRAVDKIVPKLVHMIDNAVGLASMGCAEFEDRMAAQRETMAGYAGEFPALLELHRLLTLRVSAVLADAEPAWPMSVLDGACRDVRAALAMHEGPTREPQP